MRDVPPPFAAGELPPKKVAWLHPFQLLRSSYHVWLSTIAKEYIDRRETLAALDALQAPRDLLGALKPWSSFDASLSDELLQRGVWIDFVADIGDSWNATYATALLLARRSLKVQGEPDELPSAHVVVLGGDLVYPTPSRDQYRRKMRSALVGARPGAEEINAPALLAIPGNHDWYDGLTNFVREFCQGGRIGGWSLFQRRSYFAVKLVQGWWLWGIDIALDTRIDPPQQAYFLSILKKENPLAQVDLQTQSIPQQRFAAGDNIILCTAKPAWFNSHDRPADAYKNLSYFVREIVEKHGGCVRVILAGDLHHYSRYENRFGDQVITAGGGGAYLTGTHRLPYQVPDLCASPYESGLAGIATSEDAKPENAYKATNFPYPSRSDSRRLALGGLLLPLRPANWPFAAFVGFIYWLFVWTLVQSREDLLVRSRKAIVWIPFDLALTPAATVAFFLAAVILASAVVLAAAGHTSRFRPLNIAWGLLHGFAHMATALVVAWHVHHSSVADLFERLLPYTRGAPATVFTAGLILVGGFVGAALVGIYLVVSDFLFGWHTNEVFASQSIMKYRNFLRMHLSTDGTLTLYPIGLRRIPRKWRFAVSRQEHEPYYEPADRVLTPHLIEGPIEIRRRTQSRQP